MKGHDLEPDQIPVTHAPTENPRWLRQHHGSKASNALSLSARRTSHLITTLARCSRPSARVRAGFGRAVLARISRGGLRCATLYGTLPYTVRISEIAMARPNTAEPRTHRLEARIAPKALDLIKRAAEAKGSSLSDFVVAAAREVAARELQEQNIIRLSAQEQRQFVALLLDPRKPNKSLKRAAAAHTKLIKR